jgi:hypothetical protein
MMPDSSARLRILDLWVRTVFRRRQLQDAAVLAAGYRVIIDGASSRCECESGRMCDDGIGLLSQCARCMAGLFRKGRCCLPSYHVPREVRRALVLMSHKRCCPIDCFSHKGALVPNARYMAKWVPGSREIRDQIA